jgi:hypothetical protein
MPDGETNFEGYVRARLEDIGRVQGEQRLEVQAVRIQVTELSVSVGALKATARAWGIFAGMVSGAVTGMGLKFWGK